jgi:O-antigen/teichoic acid export membrane protein
LALLDAAYGRFFKTGARGIRGSFRFAVKLLPISMLYSVLVAVALWFTAPILPLILGKGYANSVEVLRWLAIIPVAQGASYLLMQSLTGGGHQRARAIGQMVLAGVNVVGNAMLIPTYGWKAAASMAVASELILCAVMYGLCRWTLAEVPPEDEADAPPSSTSTGDTRP